MTIDFIKKQIAFENWANKKLIDTLRKIEQPDERVLDLFYHILSASSIWLDRAKGNTSTLKLWDKKSLDECSVLIDSNYLQWNDYLTMLSEVELSKLISFKMPNSDIARKISFADAVTHIINHSSYHRGQIIVKIKGQVETLPLTTYVAFASVEE